MAEIKSVSTSEQIKYPTLEEFKKMDTVAKTEMFSSLPLSVQKLLIDCSAFTDSVRSDMAQSVSKTEIEEFEEAKKLLLETLFLTETEEGRLKVTEQMKNFI